MRSGPHEVSSPQHLVVDLHHADGDLVVPVQFVRHLGEQQAESALVDARVIQRSLNTPHRYMFHTTEEEEEEEGLHMLPWKRLMVPPW